MIESGRKIFELFLARIPEISTRRCLEALCQQPGMKRSDLEKLLPGVGVADELLRLEELSLVVNAWTHWAPTWLGYGVFNWAQQLAWADLLGETPPEPRPLENGMNAVPGCARFRRQYASGICWCGRARKDHVDQVLRAAERLLRPGY